jgi:hypothetical protein
MYGPPPPLPPPTYGYAAYGAAPGMVVGMDWSGATPNTTTPTSSAATATTATTAAATASGAMTTTSVGGSNNGSSSNGSGFALSLAIRLGGPELIR